MTSAPSPQRVVRIAVLGCGTVGSALIGILQDRAESLAVQCGARLELGGIAVNDLSAARAPHIPVPLHVSAFSSTSPKACQSSASPSVMMTVSMTGCSSGSRSPNSSS